MKKRVIFLRFVIFLLLFLTAFYVATEVLKDKRVELEYDVTAKVKGFYAEPADTLDFVFIGSSQLYADIAPNVLFAEYGITSYDFCANEQPLWISYYYIKEALRRQKPKAVVLDVFTVYGETYEENGVNHINLDDLPWNGNKFGAIKNGVAPKDRMEFYVEMVQYHDTWAQLDKQKIINTFYHKNNVYKGYSPFVVAHSYADEPAPEVTGQTERAKIPARSLEWLDKIVRLTESEGVDLILIKTPNGSAERQMLYNSVDDYAKERDLPFLNMNLIFDGEAHINILQAEKVTKYLGAYLSDRYEITDKREDPAYAAWHEDGRYFYHKKDKCLLISAQNAADYFAFLRDTEAVKMIALKWDGAHPLPEETFALLNKLGAAGEIARAAYFGEAEQSEESAAEDKTGQGDISVCLLLLDQENKVLLTMKSGGGQPEALTHAGHTWELSFDPAAEKRQTALLMDGDNYSLDKYGLNVFVYDTLLEEVVDFIALDSGQDEVIVRE